jgi:glucose/arabinose dehydrogenase
MLAALFGPACDGGSDDAPESRPTQDLLSVPFRVSRPFLVPLPTGYRIETVLEGLNLPTSLAATPDGRLLITEQTEGRVRVVRDGQLLEEPWFELPVYFAEGQFLQELGLVTIAVDPLFEENGFVYVYYTEQDAGGERRTVFARLRDVDGHGTDLTPLVTVEFAPEKIHIAGGIAFDGDDAILLGVGDHEQAGLAPQLDSIAGKVLRIDREGNALPDNPFVGRDDADPRIYAYGLRNPFGIAVDRASGRRYITENRDVAGDAVYELEAGADYGWPTHRVALREPLVIYEDPVGPAGITVYQGTVLPEFVGDVFYCHFHGGGALHWSEPDELAGFDLYRRDRLIGPGCSSGVAEGADGFLYYLSYGNGTLIRIAR